MGANWGDEIQKTKAQLGKLLVLIKMNGRNWDPITVVDQVQGRGLSLKKVRLDSLKIGHFLFRLNRCKLIHNTVVTENPLSQAIAQ